MISVFIRLALTIALLTVVWMNTHWSVALTLTNLTVAAECVTWWMRGARKRIEGLEMRVYQGVVYHDE